MRAPSLNTFLFIIIIILGAVLIGQATEIDFAFWKYFQKPVEIVVNEESPIITPQNLTFQQYLDEGDELANKGIIELAIAHYANATSLEPDSLIPKLRTIEAYYQHGDFSRAVQNTNRTLEDHPNSIELKTLLAKSYLAANNIEEAQKAISDIENPNAEGSYFQGVLAAISGNRNAAGQFLHRVTEITENDPTEANIEWQTKAQRLIDAYHYYDEFRDSPNPHFRALLIQALAQNEQYHLALSEAKKLVIDYPEYRDAWIIRGHTELIINNPNAAIQSFTSAISIDQTLPEPRYYLAIAYLKVGDPDSAITNLEIAENLGWDNQSALAEKRALAYTQKNDWHKAALEYEKVLAAGDDLDPSFLIKPLWEVF